MAIFSEEFTASVKSKVDSVVDKVKGVSKLSLPTLLIGGFVGSTILVGGTAATARQIIGSNMGNQCRVAADAYIELANDQGEDLTKLNGMLREVASNPWSALGLVGPVTVIGERAGDRWEEIEEAESNYLSACVPDNDFQSFIFGGYVEEARREKWAAEDTMEETRKETEYWFNRLDW